MEQKIDPPNLGFWTLTFTFFQIILAMFPKKLVACKWNRKVQRKQKIVKILKFFNFNSFFLYDGAKNRPPPQPRFLNSYFHLLPYYSCDVSKKIVACKWNWKVQRRQKIVKILKFFNFKSFFLSDGAKNRPPQPRFLDFYVHLLSN